MTRVNAPFISTGAATWAAVCGFGLVIGVRQLLVARIGSDLWQVGLGMVGISILACLGIVALWAWLEIELALDTDAVTARRWLTIPFGGSGTRVRYADIDGATFVAQPGYGRYLELRTAERRVRIQTDAMPERARIAAAAAFTERGIALSAEYERRDED